ncbi:hypothetical protein [Virgibacillus salexigens]|uniref:LysM domain-containing protein n=1 Tax=Virgibacillus kapii TaxID=1638645 RepID=A0ABQ2D777_9BACI|nr:hypothetical protein [Virgibacillus kapii]GGJ47851.1 hypothetical protein GCM10007111_07360 [Virgibacillus kapii]
MYILKKLAIWLLIILMLSIIYKDISNISITNDGPQLKQQKEQPIFSSYHVITKKVQAGETVLSIMEEINQSKLNHLNIEKIIQDFQTVNPHTDPFRLEVGKYYHFPAYE